MLLKIPQILDTTGVARARQLLAAAPWADGRTTAGRQAAQVKNNEQLQPGSEPHRELQALVLQALEKHPQFFSATLPKRVLPPLFNRYAGAANAYGSHVDQAVRYLPGGVQRVRTDISCTLFLSDPASYDGGELVIEHSFGEQRVKLAAGDLVVYPGTSVHRVEPVTPGMLLLDREHGARRRAAPPALRDGHGPDEAARRTGRDARAGAADRHVSQPLEDVGRYMRPLVQGVPWPLPRGDGDARGIDRQAHRHDGPAWERPGARPETSS
jgi:PKHD-type hydroxylase